jgi:hypothetical protein
LQCVTDGVGTDPGASEEVAKELTFTATVSATKDSDQYLMTIAVMQGQLNISLQQKIQETTGLVLAD